MSNPIVHQRSKATAYALWLFCFFSVFGIHRFYARRYFSGILYLITFGFFGLGQLIDLLLIPNMIDEENLKIKALYGYQPNQASFYQTPESIVVNLPQSQTLQKTTELNSEKAPKSKNIDREILRVCKENEGATMAEIFLEVDEELEQVEQRIEDLMKKNLLVIDNRTDDGAVIYKLN